MRVAFVLVALAGCNQILGNGDFKTGSAGRDGAVDVMVDADFSGCAARGLPPTTLSGTVYAPNGTLPLYGAAVYVPSTNLATIPGGVSGPTCVSGSPVAITHSDSSGKFHLVDVPAGDVKLVVQVGKWRREGVVVPNVQACMDNTVDPSLTRLPRLTSEGSLPHIAITTGLADSVECLARDVGVDATEIGTGDNFAGHVHLYAENGVSSFAATGQTFDAASKLYPGTTLANYDIVMYGCTGNTTMNATAALATELLSWANQGGWVFLTHYQYPWLQFAPNPWPGLAQFTGMSTLMTTTDSVDTSTPIGQAFQQWLVVVGASTTQGQLIVTNARQTCTSADATMTTRRLYLDPTLNSGTSGVQAFTWDGSAGGRMTYDDIHVGNSPMTGVAYPNECSTSPNTQELAVMFQLFETPTCN